jgi:cytochrome d ubiquinol oxidase subunit I
VTPTGLLVLPTESVGLLGASSGDLLAARNQMAFTLGIHIVLACFGVAFPAITLLANWRGVRHDDADALLLARRWSKVMAVLFAVGAVTGTVLSFEMGLLWPGLMETYGDVFGIPFAIEGLFFFTEAIFLAIYIYGWDRLSPRRHLLTGLPLVIAGIGGTFSVVAANSWMNQPAGFSLAADGTVVDVDPVAAIFNDATWYEVPHMLLAAYLVGGFTVASVYAVGMLRGRRDRYHRLGFLIPFTVASVLLPVQLFVGDLAARAIFDDQPTKFAAQELVWETGDGQPEVLGGIMDEETGEIRWGIPIPDLASILAGYSPDTEIQGLTAVPPEDRPPANVVHLAFDAMVGAATALAALSGWFAIAWWRRRDLPRSRWFLRGAAGAGALAVVALEAGWIVTEVGRQPWVVYGYLRTEDAVTDAEGLWWSLGIVVVVYVALITATLVVLRGMARRWRAESGDGDDGRPGPYGPRQRRHEAARVLAEPTEAAGR